MAIEPNPYSAPTTWNFNPLANTSNVINYDVSTEPYDKSTQPYDGFSTKTSTANWKNPTAYSSSLVAGATQQYYGGPSTVPLYAGPTTWYANATPDNLSGQYDPNNTAYSNLYTYDNVSPTGTSTYSNPTTLYASTTTFYSGVNSTSQPYDSSTREYDGMNGKSFSNWKNPTDWTVIAGSKDF